MTADLIEKHDPLPDCDCGDCARHERDALRAILRQESARLDFFCSWHGSIGEETTRHGKHSFYLGDRNGEHHGKTWREAIDAARKANACPPPKT